MKRVNLGCGPNALSGWVNYDNSYSLVASRLPKIIISIISKLNLIEKNRINLILKYKSQNIQWANLTKKIPEKENTVDVIYISHVIEHLDFEELDLLFKEIKRVMKEGAILRVSVPDFKKLVDDYVMNGDANEFLRKSLLTNNRPKTFIEKIQLLLAGTRNHQWMYDEKNLQDLLYKKGFKKITVLIPGETMINHIDGLDLYERSEESIYIECIK